jgi:sec-independent protein translocase protein TatC
MAESPKPKPNPIAAAAEAASRMPFMEHLRELRTRLRNSVLALVVGFVVAYTFSQDLLHLLEAPLAQAFANHPELDMNGKLHVLSMMEMLWTRLSIAFWVGIFISSPVIFYQFWLFVAPGLYGHERRVALPFAALSGVFFIGGGLFCYFLVLPTVWDFLLVYSMEESGVLSEGPIRVSAMLTVSEYYALGKRLIVGFGLVFELPLVIFFLSMVGLVTYRGLWKFNRYAVVLAFVFSAILTPPDPISQIAMAGPIVVLYNLSIAVSFVVTKRREAKNPPPPADDPDDDDHDHDHDAP